MYSEDDWKDIFLVVFVFNYIEGHVDVVSFIANLEKTILHWMLED